MEDTSCETWGEVRVNITEDVREVGCEVEDWIQLAQYGGQ
jgi:hypothetical protein